MKNKLLPAVAFMAVLSGGCQKAPNVRAEYGSDPEIGCATFVRESVGDSLMLRAGEPLKDDTEALDNELRRRIYKACRRYYEVAGQYPGMK